jgi:hypothetical protein
MRTVPVLWPVQNLEPIAGGRRPERHALRGPRSGARLGSGADHDAGGLDRCGVRAGRLTAPRAALAYLARSRTAATNAELVALLGVSRGESVLDLTRHSGVWLATDARVREQLSNSEAELDESRPSELN